MFTLTICMCPSAKIPWYMLEESNIHRKSYRGVETRQLKTAPKRIQQIQRLMSNQSQAQFLFHYFQD